MTISLGRESGNLPNSDNDSTPLAITVENSLVSIISEVSVTTPDQITTSTAEVHPEESGLLPTLPMTSSANTNFALFEEGDYSDGYIPHQLIENEYGDDLVYDEYPIDSGNMSKPIDMYTCTPSAEHNPNQGPEETYTEIYASVVVVVAEPTSSNEADITKMTAKIIKEQLKWQEMATNGWRNKVLVDQLIDAVCHNVPLVDNQNKKVMDNFSGSGFNAGEY